jgi:hypothetical protein
MSQPFCEPYGPCEDLDGRLVIDRTMQGPALAVEDGELPFGSLTMQGASLRPYFHTFFEQRWIPKEACYGPVRSVMGLAPAESITTDVRQREQVDYVRIVQTAMESSEVRTTTRRHGRELIDTDYEGNSVEMSPMSVLFGGSFFEDAFDVVTAPVRAGVDAVNGLIDTAQNGIDSLFGGGGDGGQPQPAATKTLDEIDETLDTVQRTESQQSRTETTTSRTVAVERSVTRTFSNPYRDRSLELRFIPVFRHFEVVTTLFRVDFGVLLHAGPLRFPGRGVGAAFGDFLQRRAVDPRIVSVANAELGLDDELRSDVRASAVSEHLNANAGFYTKRFLTHLQDHREVPVLAQPILDLLGGRQTRAGAARSQARLQRALEWSRLQVRDNTIYVPLTDEGNLVGALGQRKPVLDLADKLGKTIRNPAWLKRVVRRRDVHLFMGTHIEAVAGECVLADLPEPPTP